MHMRSAGLALRVGRMAERTRLRHSGLLTAVARALVGPGPSNACGSSGVCSGLVGSTTQLAGCLTPARAYSSFGFGSASADSLRSLEAAANNPGNARNIEVQRQYIDALSDAGHNAEVIRRVESGRFLVDFNIIDNAYTKALMLEKGLSYKDAYMRGRGVLSALPDHAAGRMGAGMSHGGGGGGFGGAAGGAGGPTSWFMPVAVPMPMSMPMAAGGAPGMYPFAGAAGFGGVGGGSAAGGAGSGSGSGGSARDNAAGLNGARGTYAAPLVVTTMPSPGWAKPLILRFVLSTALFLGFIYYIRESMGDMGGDGKGGGGLLSRIAGDADDSLAEQPTTRFADVRGVDEAKQELVDIVSFLKNPEKYRRLGAKIPRGILLVGPPGTGKTLLARAIAGEAGCRFYAKSGSEFEEMLVGLGARRIRDLFSAARKNSPSIIFIDEIDAVGGKRKMEGFNGSSSGRQTINQLLACMDGFEKGDNVIVIAATNFADSLDPALLRPGRFDSTVQVNAPDVKGRKDIIDLYLKKIVYAKPGSEGGIDSELLARATPGMTGAQLESLINTAAIQAANRGADRVQMCDMEEARDRVWMGPALKSKKVTPEDMKMTAYHEGGHTLAQLLTPGASDLHKVTILPRGRSGGATFSLPNDSGYQTKQQILAYIDVCMGGRVAEELLNGPMAVTTGAGMDMQQASSAARSFITRYSMSDLGLAVYDSSDRNSLPSEAKQAAIDAEVERMLDASYKRVFALIKEHRADLDRLAAALLERESLTAEECRDVVAGKTLPPLVMSGGKDKEKDSGKPRGGKEKEGKDKKDKEKEKEKPKVGGVWS